MASNKRTSEEAFGDWIHMPTMKRVKAHYKERLAEFDAYRENIKRDTVIGCMRLFAQAERGANINIQRDMQRRINRAEYFQNFFSKRCTELVGQLDYATDLLRQIAVQFPDVQEEFAIQFAALVSGGETTEEELLE